MEKPKIEEIVQTVDDNIKIYAKHIEYLRQIIGLNVSIKNAFQDFAPQLDYSDFEEMITMHSFNALLTISLLDLFVICKNLVTAETDWEKAYFIKQGYLTIYETIDTYNNHNQHISKLIDTKYINFKTDYLSVSSNLKQFKKNYSYQDNIKDVRHFIAGHINKDFLNYYDTLLKIKGANDSEAILAFIQILKELENISFKMENFSRQYAFTELEKDGMGSTLEEISSNFDKKLSALKDLIEQKKLEYEQQLPPTSAFGVNAV
jgi:hypothetical protein